MYWLQHDMMYEKCVIRHVQQIGTYADREKLGTFINAYSAITGMSRRWCQPGKLTCKKFMKKNRRKGVYIRAWK
jgi:hypothetical protein